MRRWPLIGLLLIVCGIPLAALPATQPDVLSDTIQRELRRATAALAKADPSPYYLGYTVDDASSATIVGANGSLIVSSEAHNRGADVIMRVGSAALDNTHGQSRGSGIMSGALPLNDDADAI